MLSGLCDDCQHRASRAGLGCEALPLWKRTLSSCFLTHSLRFAVVGSCRTPGLWWPLRQGLWCEQVQESWVWDCALSCVCPPDLPRSPPSGPRLWVWKTKYGKEQAPASAAMGPSSLWTPAGCPRSPWTLVKVDPRSGPLLSPAPLCCGFWAVMSPPLKDVFTLTSGQMLGSLGMAMCYVYRILSTAQIKLCKHSDWYLMLIYYKVYLYNFRDTYVIKDALPPVSTSSSPQRVGQVDIFIFVYSVGFHVQNPA